MNRRDWMKTAAGATAVAAFPLDLLAQRATTGGAATLETEICSPQPPAHVDDDDVVE